MPGLKTELSIATTWIRAFASVYMQNENLFSYTEDSLIEHGIDLLDVRNILRFGEVIHEDVLDHPCGLWIVEGADCDDQRYVLTVHVFSDRYAIQLVSIERRDDNEPNRAA